MVILEDTRQQDGKHDHIHEWFDAHGIAYDRCKLYVGDYIVANDGKVAVDTKQSVVELAADLHADHERFRNECLRAQSAGIQLIILTEEELPGGSLLQWKPPRNVRVRFDRVAMRKQMVTMMNKYGVLFRFCHRDKTAEMILKYLKVGDSCGL